MLLRALEAALSATVATTIGDAAFCKVSSARPLEVGSHLSVLFWVSLPHLRAAGAFRLFFVLSFALFSWPTRRRLYSIVFQNYFPSLFPMDVRIGTVLVLNNLF